MWQRDSRVEEDCSTAGDADKQSSPNSVISSFPHSSTRYSLSSRSRYLLDGVLPALYQMRICQAYLANGGDPFADYYISPLRAPLSLLVRFPPLFIHVGEVDPLLDDSVGFMRRVRQAKGLKEREVGEDGWRGELLVIEKVSHAYLHVAGMLQESRTALKQSEAWLRQILEPDTCQAEEQCDGHQEHSSAVTARTVV